MENNDDILLSPIDFSQEKRDSHDGCWKRKLILLQAAQSGLALKVEDLSIEKSLPASWLGLVITDKLSWTITSGEIIAAYDVNPFVFSKLLVFFDASRKTKIVGDADPLFETLTIGSLAAFNNRQVLEQWFIHMSLQQSWSSGFSALAAFLRRTEHYWLVQFLFEHLLSGSPLQLQNLGKDYGVSNSHFRRLCRKALGRNTKRELRLWRVSQALMSIAGQEGNLTQVAIKYGYASSSHFSNEVKEILGVSPRGLTDILNLAPK